MKKFLFALQDTKAEIFHAPFLAPSRAFVFRALGDEIARGGEGNMVAAHPEDFELWQVGEYEEDTGVITPAQVYVCSVLSLKV